MSAVSTGLQRRLSRRLIPVLTTLALMAAVLTVAAVSDVASAPAASAAVGGSPSAEAVALAEAARTGHRVEVVEEDTETETVWANPDGTVTTDVSQVPVRVPDADGKLVAINTDLQSSGGRLEPKVSPSDVSLSATGAGTLASLETAHGTSFGLRFGEDVSTPKVNDATATYPVTDSAPASAADSVQISATASGFTTRVRLDEAPTVAPSYVFPLQLDGLSASLEQNSLMLRDGADKLVAQSAPLRMWDSQLDAAGDRANQTLVDAALVTVDGKPALKLTPSMEWLTDPATQYPVTIDPDMSKDITYNRDTYYFSGQATNDPRGLDYSLRLGSDNGTRRFRTYTQFDTDAYLGKDITSATLNLYQYYAGTCSTREMNVRPTDAKAVENVVWSTSPTHNNDLRYRSAKSFNHSTSCSPGFEPIDVTPVVSAWSSDDLSRTGIGLLASDELDQTYEKRFCSNDYDTSSGICNTTTRRPTLSITYVPDLGDQSSYSTSDHKLNDRTELKVNNDNGNALLKADDVKITSLGQGLNISRFYNSRSNSDEPGVFGPRWKASVGPDVYLEKRDQYRYDYHDASGAVYGPFLRKSATSADSDYNDFKTPLNGIDGDLKDKTGGTFELTMHQSQMVYEFKKVDTGSDNLYLTKTTDRSGNKVTYAYATGGHELASVTDEGGHTISVAYSAGRVSTITDANGPSTRIWYYYYTSGRLTSYKDPENKTVTYGWNSAADPEITSITDATNASGAQPMTTFTVAANQVTALMYSSSTTTGATVGYSFGYHDDIAWTSACESGDDSGTQVTSTQATDNPIIYCFRNRDADGNPAIHRVVDGNGNSVETKYNADKQPTSFEGGEKTGSTAATYGGGGVAENLDKVTDPSDSGPGNGTSTQYTYKSGSSLPGGKYLPTSKTDGNGVCTQYEYDPKGRLADAYLDTDTGTCEDDNNGLRYHQSLNTDGTVASSYDPNGGTSAGNYTDYAYWVTTDSGYVTGSKGQLKTLIKPGGSCGSSRTLCTSYTYDGLARIKTMTDGRGKVTCYAYDKIDRLTQVLTDAGSSCTPSTGNTVNYVYDAEGNMTSRVDAQGTTLFTYDRLNRQTSVTTPDASVVTYGYNDDGKLTSVATSVAGATAHTVTYTYDAGQQPIGVSDTDMNPSDPIHKISLGHNKNNKQTAITYPSTNNVSVARTYTNGSRPNQITVSEAGSSPTSYPDWNYDYKTSGGKDTNHVQKITIDGSTSAINQTVTYDYDGYGRLTGANDPSSSQDYTYTYTENSNLKSEQGGAGTTYYGYDKASQLCYQGPTVGSPVVTDGCPTTPPGTGGSADTKISQDNAGNSLGTAATPLTYNAYNQVATIGASTQKYNDLGNDLRTQTETGTTLINSSLGVLARKTSTGTTYYVRSPSGKILAEYGTSGTYYFITNDQGSVTAVAKANGDRAGYYRYSPYGSPAIIEDDTNNTLAGNPWRYIGGYYDIEGDGYTKLGSRYYDNHSHFTQTDPKSGNLDKPLTVSRYAYGTSDPINNLDPTGQVNWAQVGIGAFGIVSGVGDIGLGIAVGTLGAPTGIAVPLGGVIAAGGALEFGLGARDVVEGFKE